ncbi:MAG TPA: N-acetylmuramoyl-L-alanine amidase [Acidimicrobiia bacterium]|nr:N-acetylmuramoyl-L-alanine amidase [Acidimicrobiia bacterium]
MDRQTRRMHRTRVRARRIKLVVGISIAATSVVVLAAAAFGQQGSGTQRPPKPRVDVADLTAPQQTVDAGWEAQVGTDANLVGVQWSGDEGADFTVEVRDGRGTWRTAGDVGKNDAKPDPGSPDAAAAATHQGTTNASEPIWVGKDVSGVRVRLDDGTAQDVKLHVIASFDGKKPEANVESTGTPPAPSTPAPAPTAPAPTAPAAPPGGGSGAVTTTSRAAEQGFGLPQSLAAVALSTVAVAFVVRRRRVLAVLVAAVILVAAACAPTKNGAGGGRPIPDAIVARSQWAPDLPWNWGACPGGPQYAPYMSTAIVHHTVNSNGYGPGDSVGIMRGIWAYHVQSLGYCDIAYNFIVDNYGVPYEGRLGGIDQSVVGAHAIGANYGTTGVAMLGTFTSVLPSGAALGTLENLIRWKLLIHGDNPFDDAAADILGHRDTSATECPGNALYGYLPSIRDIVKFFWPQ